MTGDFRSQPSNEQTQGDWLIVSRQLFFRPDARGYTGIRDEAGRYSYEAASAYANHGECKIMRVDDAPEFLPAAYNDLVIGHLQKQRDEARARVIKLERGLTWIVNSPSAHPANMVKVAEDALQPKAGS